MAEGRGAASEDDGEDEAGDGDLASVLDNDVDEEEKVNEDLLVASSDDTDEQRRRLKERAEEAEQRERIASLKVTDPDLWAALYADDDEVLPPTKPAPRRRGGQTFTTMPVPAARHPKSHHR